MQIGENGVPAEEAGLPREEQQVPGELQCGGVEHAGQVRLPMISSSLYLLSNLLLFFGKHVDNALYLCMRRKISSDLRYMEMMQEKIRLNITRYIT